MDLSGQWHGASQSLELERVGADPDLDDSDWPTLSVPGHWGESDDFADEAGPVLYRRRFRFDPPPAPARVWLRLDGILGESEVWLDGVHLGDTGVYFASRRFEITELLRTEGPPDREHVLAVEVACPEPSAGAKRSLTGSLQSGPMAPPGSPGGIWRGASVDTTGPVAIKRARLLCTKANNNRAELQFRIVIDAEEAGHVRVDTSIVGPDGSTAGGVADHEVASGENQIEWTATVDDPHLWWPASLGDQPLYDVGVALRTADEGADATVTDRRHWRTGIRTATVDDLQWRINGEKLFVKGISVGPHDRFLGSVEAARFGHDVRTVRDAGLDMIRVQGHVSRPELYQAADELGVLIWQDLPLVGAYSTGARSKAQTLARAAVDELGHHPSIAVWCGHDEPNGPPIPEPEQVVDPLRRGSRRLTRHLFPSWSRSVLDPLIRRELRSADRSRSVITRSGNLPNLVDFAGSDSHLWLGWHAGRPEDLADILRRWPRLGAFVGAIGTQSAAVADWPADAPQWPTAERGAFERYIPRGAYGDGASWAEATRAYQADVIRTQIETIRRLKYRPAGGFCVVSLFDAEADGGFGVLDHHRRRKPAFDVMVDACRPLVVIADAPPAIVTPGEHLDLAVHAVSDLRDELGTVRVSARARLAGWQTRQGWEGPLPADSCAFIGSFGFEVPDLTGALVIDFELEAENLAATNRYQTVVIPPSEAMNRSTARPRSS